MDWKEGKLEWGDPLNNKEIRASREINYYFNRGDKVVFDEAVMTKKELEDYDRYLGHEFEITSRVGSQVDGGIKYAHSVSRDYGEQRCDVAGSFLENITPFLKKSEI